MTSAQAIVFVSILCAGFSALIAYRKGRSAGWFAVAGFVLGIIGLLWAAFARSATQKEEIRRQRIERSRRYDGQHGQQ
jgi:threonine dehydrogenase-like Zn-dependent dehydrogenase